MYEHGRHNESWKNLCTDEVEDFLNHVGLFRSVVLAKIEEAYLIIKEHADPRLSPREQAEELYKTGFYWNYRWEVEHLMKTNLLQHPDWEYSLQFFRVYRNLLTLSDEEEWSEWKMYT